MVKSRRNRNRASRRVSRKAHRASRRAHRQRRYRGGNAPVNVPTVDPAVVAQSLAQGVEFKKNLTGGSAPVASITAAPLLTPTEATSARTAVLDKYISEISGMQDGGRRRRKGRKGRKASRKGRKASRKGRKASRKGRKASRKARRTMRGGVSEVNANTMLLDNYKDAGLNPEWREVQGNPAAYAPK
jgi:hypothetical protein